MAEGSVTAAHTLLMLGYLHALIWQQLNDCKAGLDPFLQDDLLYGVQKVYPRLSGAEVAVQRLLAVCDNFGPKHTAHLIVTVAFALDAEGDLEGARAYLALAFGKLNCVRL